MSLLRKRKPLFPPKVPHDLNGRIINVGLVVVPAFTCNQVGGGYTGPQISLMRSIAKSYNFTAVYITDNDVKTQNEPPPDRLAGSPGPWRVILGATLSGDVSIALGGFFLWPTLLNDFGYSQTISQEAYRFFTTSNLILSNRTEYWIWIITLERITMQLLTALAMHFLVRKGDRRKNNSAPTAMMVRFKIQRSCHY